MVDGGKVRALVNFTRSVMPRSRTCRLHDAAKAAIDDPQFGQIVSARGIDVDYRPAEPLRADLWREYKALTPVLKRTGMIKR